MLVTKFMQIHLQNREKFHDFIIKFKYTLQKIPQEKHPNQSMIFCCFNNSMLDNVKYLIKYSRITTLEEAMEKAYEMEENMIEGITDTKLIWGNFKGRCQVYE